MKGERQRKDPRRRFEEEGPSTSFQQKRIPENHQEDHIPSQHRCNNAIIPYTHQLRV